VGAAIADGSAVAHKSGIVHRDLCASHHNLGTVYALASRLTEAKAEHEKTNRFARGEVDDALQELRQAAGGNDPWLVFYRFMAPGYHPGDARIDALLEEAGL